MNIDESEYKTKVSVSLPESINSEQLDQLSDIVDDSLGLQLREARLCHSFASVQKILDDLASAFNASRVPSDVKQSIAGDLADFVDKVFDKFQPKLTLRFPEALSHEKMQELLSTITNKLDEMGLLGPDVDISFALPNGNEVTLSDPVLDASLGHSHPEQTVVNQVAPETQTQGLVYAGPFRFA